jgi:hypothetical protein
VIDLEDLDEAELDAVRKEYLDLAEHAHRHIEERAKRRNSHR